MPRYCEHNRPTEVIDGDGTAVGLIGEQSPSLAVRRALSHLLAPVSAAAGTSRPAMMPLLSAMICQPTTEVSPGSSGVP